MLYTILQILVIVLLGISVLYLFIFALAGLFYRQQPYPENPALKRIALLIPGYQEDEVIAEVVTEALKQDYPKDLFDVVVIADSFLPETLAILNKLPVIVLEVRFGNSTKAQALSSAMEQLVKIYDIALILDADNLMDPDFLTKINASFEAGAVAVQGHRKAKNMDTSLAILDAISAEINNHLFRKGQRAVGLSSALSGSGMAFKYDLFKTLMQTATAIGGFDKEVEMNLLKRGMVIEYLDDAIIYDEKISHPREFTHQRRRWLAAQYFYFRRDFLPSLKAFILKSNLDYFLKSIQFLQLPRILLLGSVFFFGTIFIILNVCFCLHALLTFSWVVIMALCLLTFRLSIPFSFFRLSIMKALLQLPYTMLLMLGSLLRVKGANKKFLHTKHTYFKNQN